MSEVADAPHAPHRGWVSRLLGPFHVTGVFWFRFHAFGARRADWMIRILIPLFTGFFFCTLFAIRRAVAANLEAVLGPCGWWARQRRLWRTFETFAWCQTERYERLETDRRFEVDEADGLEHWRSLRRAGRGVLLITGHVGNWEMASAVPSDREGVTVHVVREEEMDPEAQAWVEERLGRRFGSSYVTHFASGMGPRLGLEMREALERGEVVALQGDRPRRGGRSVEVELLGRPYRLAMGPLMLARQTGVPLLPAFVRRVGRRRYALRFGAPVEVARTADRDADLAAAGKRFAAELERAVRRTPHQWFVFRELW